MNSNLTIHKLFELTGHESAVYQIIDAGEHSIITSCGNGQIAEWSKDFDRNEATLLAKTPYSVFSLCLIRESNLLLIGDLRGRMYWLNLLNKSVIKTFTLHKKTIFSIVNSGDYAYSVGGDGCIAEWNLNEMRSTKSILISNQGLRSIVIHDQWLIIGSSDSNIYILDKLTFEIIHVIENSHDSSVFKLLLSEKGIISAGRDAKIKIWKYDGFELINKVDAHWNTVNDLSFINETLIASASRDKTIRYWNWPNMTLLQTIKVNKGGHQGSVNVLAWLEKEQLLLSGGDDRKIIGWKIESY